MYSNVNKMPRGVNGTTLRKAQSTIGFCDWAVLVSQHLLVCSPFILKCFYCTHPYLAKWWGSGYNKRSWGRHSCITHAVWPGCLVMAGRGVWALVVSVTCLSEGLLRGWSLWKGLVPGRTRLREPPSRMYTCSGATSSQRGPWKPERQTQVCGRLQEPRFRQGGWQSAEERAQMQSRFTAGHLWACAPRVCRSRIAFLLLLLYGFPWSQHRGSL